jgi:hypothetical protein
MANYAEHPGARRRRCLVRPASACPAGSWCPTRLGVPCCSRREPDPAVSALIRVLPRSRGTAAGQLPPAGPCHPAVAARFYPLPVPGQGAARVPAAPSPSQECLPNALRISAPSIRGVIIHNDDRSPCAGLSGKENGPGSSHPADIRPHPEPATHRKLTLFRDAHGSGSLDRLAGWPPGQSAPTVTTAGSSTASAKLAQQISMRAARCALQGMRMGAIHVSGSPVPKTPRIAKDST